MDLISAGLGFGSAALLAAGAYFLWVRPSIGRASAIAREDALRQTERVQLEAKQEAIALREKLEDEIKQKESRLHRAEEKLAAKDEALEQRRTRMDDLESDLRAKLKIAEEKLAATEEAKLAIQVELHRVSELDQTAAQQLLLKSIEGEFREIGLRKAKIVEKQAIEDADKRAKQLIIEAMQRSVVDYVTEATLAVVELPSEDMKGRIIGRDGRNIRAFEQVTGVDLIVDETPEAVVVSCFDPVRRETARLTLMNLMLDGRIHPGRIEELFEKAKTEVDRTIKEAGRRALERANVSDLHPKALEVLGRLRFRTSYGQNVLDHSVEVSRLAMMLASDLGVDVVTAKRAGLLHDIGKALGPEWEGPHAITGMEFLRGLGETPEVLHAVGAHHYDIEPTSAEAVLVILADTISAARPGARRENLEQHVQRLTALEDVANSFPGVERVFALKAGREIRVVVKPLEIDDLGAEQLAHAVATKIETELTPGVPVKVTVVREIRIQRTARS